MRLLGWLRRLGTPRSGAGKAARPETGPRPPGLPPEDAADLGGKAGSATAATRQQILRRYGRRDMHFVSARSVRLLVDAGEAFPDMLAAIEGAAEHVELETYILRDDSTGQAFREALIRAASRGVRVRLLYDWWGSWALPKRFVRALVDAGVNVGAYHPLVFRRPVWAVNKRDHRKMLVVDDVVSFTGGLNISNESALVSDGGQGWRDTHVRLDGPQAAREMTALFDHTWRRAIPYDKTLRRRTRLLWGIRQRLAAMSGTREGPAPAPGPDGDIPVCIVGNEILRHRRRIHRAYLKAICGARRYVLIENAYFIPGKAVRRALVRAAGRGVFVGVLVAARSDVPITTWATRWLYEELLAGGVHVFEWPVSMLHAKTAVIDDAWSIIGSYNFDHRSLLHQLESVALVADPALAACLRDQTLSDMSRCREVSLETHRRRPWRKKALEYFAYLIRHWL